VTDKQDLRGSVCSTLTDERREWIEQADERTKGHLTLCGQHLWDSDDYLARSFGTLFRRAYSPFTRRENVPVRLDWCDHGHTTHYFVNGYHVGNESSAQTTPRNYLESIWSAGRHIASHLAATWRDEERDR
jgi:hypothetical protein